MLKLHDFCNRARLALLCKKEGADAIREELAGRGVILEDSSAGTTWRHG